MSIAKKILVIDDEREVADLIERTLNIDGYTVIRTGNGLTGLKLAQTHMPDLIIMDVVMPGMDGLTLCKTLRQDKHLRLVPIIILTGSKIYPNDKIAGLSIGADDYVLKPFYPQELLIRIRQLLKRTEEHMSVNPLTKLPGSCILEAEVNKRIERNEYFSICYFDLDNFKAFNDYYSYQQGDKVIQFFAKLLIEAVNEKGSENDVLVHIGGDDFILLTLPDKVQSVYDYINKKFENEITQYYDKEDAKKGFIITTNRKGEKERFSIITVSVAAASNTIRKISHYAEIVDILSELKKFAKTMPGNKLVNDRRHGGVLK